MSEAKTIKVLESLGGSAEMSEIRKRAREMYPELQLGRIIHNPLKSLLAQKKVTCRGKLKRGRGKKGQKSAPTYWTLVGYTPPVKSAAQLLGETVEKMQPSEELADNIEQASKEFRGRAEMISPREILKENMLREKIEDIPMHEDVPVVNTEILKLKEPPTGNEVYKLTEKDKQIEEYVKSYNKPPIEGSNGTLVNELKQAIDKPYLDDLKKVVETVEKKDSHYRGRHDIIYDILGYLDSQEAGQSGQYCPGVHVTEIMYKTMLSHWQLKRYIVTLLKNDLIIKTDVGYKLSVKGLSYLHTFKSIPINFD